MSDYPRPDHHNRKPIAAAIVSGLFAVSSTAMVTAGETPANPPAAKHSTLMLASGCNPCAVKTACNPCNPCAAKTACNPCAAKTACNPCNPCAANNPCTPCNPCAAKNPCKTT